MKKIFLIFSIFVLLCSGCNEKEHANILFNSEPITYESIMYPKKDFALGQRIYYLFFTPEKLNCEFIRVQVFKVSDTINRGGYNIYWTNDYRVMKQNVYYYYNNFTIHQKGRYVMQVFSINNLGKPLAYNEFFIR